MSLIFENQTTILKPSSNKKMYECYIWISPECDGDGYSVSLPQLPGVCSQGNTEEEAVKNIIEAFQATAACYLETDGKIPWLNKDEIEDIPVGVKEKWIAVNV